VTVVLDDVHWADAGSVELLEYLLRQPPRAPFLLAVAYRPRQVEPRLAAALARAAESAALRLDLPPLSLPDVAELLGTGVSRARTQELFEVSGGNPFYLDALARLASSGQLPAGGLLPEADGAVRMALAAEFGALPADAALVAQAAAVVGDPFDPELIAEVAEVDVEATVRILDELSRRDLIRPEDRARRFHYRHPLVRSAAYSSAPAGWRLGAHARAAAGLARRGASALTRAHHVERAAHVGDEQAIAVLVEAADAAFATAPSLAVHWLRTAISLLPHEPSADDRRLGLMLLRARGLIVTGRFAECRQVLHDVMALVPGGSSTQRRTAVSMWGAVERMTGRYEEAHALLVAELATIPEQDAPFAAALRTEMAAGELHCSRFAEAHQAVAEIVAAGELPPLMHAFAQTILSSAATYLGYFDEAHRALGEAQQCLDGLSDGVLAQRLSLTLEVAWCEMGLERYDDALRHIRRGMALATRTGQGHMHADLLLALAVVYMQLGRLTDAAECAEATAEHLLLLGRGALREAMLARQSEIALLSGDPKAALRLAEQSVAAALPGQFWWSGLGSMTLAAARLATGDPDGCLREVERAGDPAQIAHTGAMRRIWHDVLVQAELARGDIPAAVRWAEAAEAALLPGDLPGRTAHAGLAVARAALAAGDAQAAAARAEQVAEAFAAVRYPLFEGQARQLLAAALDALGRAEEAAEQLGQAKRIFAGCGARGMHAAVVHDQRARGARLPRTRGGDSIAGLTGRQREIAELVAEGCTNRQVAERLFMSPRTVETHLSQIFSKLGISSRAALASHLARMKP
jgi:ATP/maltotriose-dependent transcriptional regulator MalT